MHRAACSMYLAVRADTNGCNHCFETVLSDNLPQRFGEHCHIRHVYDWFCFHCNTNADRGVPGKMLRKKIVVVLVGSMLSSIHFPQTMDRVCLASKPSENQPDLNQVALGERAPVENSTDTL
nr:hypothetical protein Iba_chr14fCG0700 [Ipomoea batatas]